MYSVFLVDRLGTDFRIVSVFSTLVHYVKLPITKFGDLKLPSNNKTLSVDSVTSQSL